MVALAMALFLNHPSSILRTPSGMTTSLRARRSRRGLLPIVAPNGSTTASLTLFRAAVRQSSWTQMTRMHSQS